jgi:cellulose synthase/poly-beta-1,6-N-acetylglucosamine synthase-like glycosyltransferase
LTAAQSIALDKHFMMEQSVRHRANLFPKFNGSAGVWRENCLIDAGGWQADTVCEDLCLSTRAILKGWKFLFLNDVVSPAELPTTLSAYKNQQARWAKGSTQCLVKFGPAILKDKNHSLMARLYALLSMAGYTTHLLLLLLLLVQVPLIYLGYRPPLAFLLFGLVGLAQPALFVMGQRELYHDWWRRLRYFPALLLVAIGLAPANTRAIVQAIFGRRHVFVRTPKGNNSAATHGQSTAARSNVYQLPGDWIVFAEFSLALYAAIGLILCLLNGNIGPMFFMLACMIGFGYVAIMSFLEQF